MQVDVSRMKDSQDLNEKREFEKYRERFLFLKWGAKAFKNMLIVPPGLGIVHQVVHKSVLTFGQLAMLR